MADDMHCLCIEAVFFALEKAGWLVKLEVSTFLNPHFVFLGLKWNLNEKSSLVQNDRVAPYSITGRHALFLNLLVAWLLSNIIKISFL